MARTVLLTLEQLAAVLRANATDADKELPLAECVSRFRKAPSFARVVWERAAERYWKDQVLIAGPVGGVDKEALDLLPATVVDPDGCRRLVMEDSCDGCKHMHFVTASETGTSHSGWGCLRSGGHAIKKCSGFERGES